MTIDSLESIPGLLKRLQIRAQTTVLDPDPDVKRLLFLKEKAIFHKFKNTFLTFVDFFSRAEHQRFTVIIYDG
jgi:hypothetical protein